MEGKKITRAKALKISKKILKDAEKERYTGRYYNKPKISVIIPTYNGEKTIKDTIESIKSQNIKANLEIIVIDDCSTDKTVEIAESLGATILRTQLGNLSTSSGLPNIGRNIGFKYATGDYICLLDQDDIWRPGKLKLQLDTMRKTDIPISFSKCCQYSGKGTEMAVGFANNDLEYDHTLTPTNEAFKEALKRNHNKMPYISSMMFKNTLTILFDEYFGEYDWVLKMLFNQKVIMFKNPLVYRKFTGENLSTKLTYRIADYFHALGQLEIHDISYSKETKIGRNRLHNSMGKYYYQNKNMKKARRYFLYSTPNLKTTIYYLTSYLPPAYNYVIKHFKVFG